MSNGDTVSCHLEWDCSVCEGRIKTFPFQPQMGVGYMASSDEQFDLPTAPLAEMERVAEIRDALADFVLSNYGDQTPPDALWAQDGLPAPASYHYKLVNIFGYRADILVPDEPVMAHSCGESRWAPDGTEMVCTDDDAAKKGPNTMRSIFARTGRPATLAVSFLAATSSARRVIQRNHSMAVSAVPSISNSHTSGPGAYRRAICSVWPSGQLTWKNPTWSEMSPVPKAPSSSGHAINSSLPNFKLPNSEKSSIPMGVFGRSPATHGYSLHSTRSNSNGSSHASKAVSTFWVHSAAVMTSGSSGQGFRNVARCLRQSPSWD